MTEYDYVQAHGWFPPVFFFGLEYVSHSGLTLRYELVTDSRYRVMGMTIGAVAAALYIVDAHSKFCLNQTSCTSY